MLIGIHAAAAFMKCLCLHWVGRLSLNLITDLWAVYHAKDVDRRVRTLPHHTWR